MITFLKAYAGVALVVLVLDGLWLAVIARNFYQGQLGHLMRQPFLATPAVLFYLVFVGAMAWLVVVPAARAESMAAAALAGAISGAVLGLAAYGTYDLTNYATLRDWPLMVTVVDLVWGASMSALAGAAAAALLQIW